MGQVILRMISHSGAGTHDIFARKLESNQVLNYHSNSVIKYRADQSNHHPMVNYTTADEIKLPVGRSFFDNTIAHFGVSILTSSCTLPGSVTIHIYARCEPVQVSIMQHFSLRHELKKNMNYYVINASLVLIVKQKLICRQKKHNHPLKLD